jgi:hypothetical protein
MIDVVNREGTGNVSHMWGAFRPHLRQFLSFAKYYFAGVIVWSAGQTKYVHEICRKIFIDPDFQPLIIYTYDDCEMGADYVYKPIAKLMNDNAVKAYVNPKETLTLDDREDTFSKNPRNGIKIPPYEPRMTPDGIMTDDIALLQLMKWLELPSVINASDIRTVDKRNIFSTSIPDYDRMTYLSSIPSSLKSMITDVDAYAHGVSYGIVPNTINAYIPDDSDEE